MAPELRLALLQARQAEASEAHRILTAPDGLRANVAETHLRARFDEQGAELTSDQDAKVQARLTLTSLGRSGGARQRVKAAKPVAGEHTVTWERPVGGARVEESWQAGPLGLEHRVMVRQRPSGEGTVELEVQVAGLTAEQDGGDVKLTSASGSLLMRAYFVRDAQGKLLAGTMRVRGESVVYAYEDAGAAYPVEVDPLVWVQQTKLLAEDKESDDTFGFSVALSADGNTALIGGTGIMGTVLVGGYEDDEGTLYDGAAFVFTRTAGVWTQQAKLMAAGQQLFESFGAAVALSSDGNTALIGAFSRDDEGIGLCGVAYIFTRTGEVWAQRAELLASDKGSGDYFGWSVALSSDGNTALIGASSESDGETLGNGAAYVFTRTAESWTQQQKIIAADKNHNDFLGSAVALSSDGNTALLGAYEEDDGGKTNNGAVYVFTRTAGVWTQQQKLLAADKESDDSFGWSVALSADGNTALISAYQEDDGATKDSGAAYVFNRTAGVWTQQAKLLANDKESGDHFGSAVALSSDGIIALIGAISESDGETLGNGAVYVFAQAAGIWTQRQKIIAVDKKHNDDFGSAVALSSNGNTALISADYNRAVYVFTPVQVGQTCSSNAECPSGFCVDGVCCNSACGGGASDCQACSVAAGAATNGLCGPTTGNACSDGNACTQTDTCQEGVCKAGNEVTCTPGECQQGGSCEVVSGACQFSNQPDGTPCSSGLCQDGSCVGASGAGGESGAGGTAGAGGEAGSAGESGAGGEAGSAGESGAGGDGGASGTAGNGGAAGDAGAAGDGGTAGDAGAAGNGGAAGDGGAAGTSGAAGGTAGTAGATSTGGSAGNGGVAGNGGAAGQAGSAGKGGAGDGGASGQGTGGQAGGGGAPVNDPAPEVEGGCGCRTTGGGREGGAWAVGLLALALTARRRRTA